MPTTLHSGEIESAPHSHVSHLETLLHGAGVAPLSHIGWIRVTGEDRVRWLNGMVTNSIQDLASGAGCYNFVLNAQGRIQGDLTAFLLPDSILLQTSRDHLPALLAHLDRFIIMDDVELADISESRHGLVIAGPHAAAVLQQLDLTSDPAAPSLRQQTTTWHSSTVDIIHAHSPLVPRYELWSDAAAIDTLNAILTANGATPVSHEALEDLRILEGTPRYGTDIRDSEAARDLPQETAQAHALHFAKGCYLGQEIVERIRSRGNVHRTFTGFQLTGTLPTSGTKLEAEGKPVGELTSVAAISLPSGTVQLALGYIRREALDKNLLLQYPGGTATPVKLPHAIS